jgi:UDP-N-acetyl-alpha-D-muramoyl-L-alanyl-L-glutamate epimerase
MRVAQEYTALRMTTREVDTATGVITLGYLLEGDRPESFTETITLPVGTAKTDTLLRTAELLHVVAGVSYYKAGAPPRVIASSPFGPAAQAFFNAVYTDGLAEYAYRNQLPHVLSLSVEVPDGFERPSETDNADGRPLSAVGGGKDSIVTLEILRDAGFDPVPFSVNPNPVIVSVNEASGRPALAARRRLDPRLFELNSAGGLNGHIPVTAINSLIAIATAAWHGLGPVVMSNERSASDPNLIWNGHEVNHQWSKGETAERLLIEAVREHVGLTEPYFSFLRPLSELRIAQLFAAHTRYDDVVTSCNQAFKLHDPTVRWCGDCPKCRFVFLAMAPFMPHDRLVHIFGHDLFADPAQLPGYRELLGLDAHKPFECVGEVEESVVAISMLEGQDFPVLDALRTEIPAEGFTKAAADREEVLSPAKIGFLPPRYADALEAALK